jgi:molybdopterin synthase sulfur carrier subunit
MSVAIGGDLFFIEEGTRMPITVRIPQAMRQHVDGNATITLEGANIKEVLDSLSVKYPNIVGRIFDNGQLRRFVNIYLNEEDIRYLDNLQSPTKDGDLIEIIPAVAGG